MTRLKISDSPGSNWRPPDAWVELETSRRRRSVHVFYATCLIRARKAVADSALPAPLMPPLCWRLGRIGDLPTQAIRPRFFLKKWKRTAETNSFPAARYSTAFDRTLLTRSLHGAHFAQPAGCAGSDGSTLPGCCPRGWPAIRNNSRSLQAVPDLMDLPLSLPEIKSGGIDDAVLRGAAWR
jgi:hypothetical protein